MSRPLISIITVVFNGAATLETTIASVINQTWKEIEYIVVDGGSTDGTLALLDKYKDQITLWVSEPDKGVYDAMNKGVRMARGEWLYFLGSDDWLYKDTVVAALFEEPANRDCHLLYGNVISPSYKGLYDGPFTLEKLLSRNVSHQAAFYRKELFQRLGEFNLQYRLHADWDFNLRCFTAEWVKTKFVAVCIAEFGAEGISSSHDVPFLRARLIPEKLHWLDKRGTRTLRRIADYDEWWRFLRNARIRDEKELEQAAGQQSLPVAIGRMIRWQRIFSPRLLRIGVFSKAWMLGSYLSNRLTGSL
ncbi:glycosyltransferase family 2 protein [Puia dinghuensis]|uniref:Glycosyltransferase 2-like domain-containing protein n=1 Tax=Puia dinghuensis TaxID=1792502 RepID=A0A8J2U8T4_9BACT|nr:glycosyltransferase family 2 protein [Puia dinghuensis]GGA86306.1 hypothetical protein GCM10011511_06680 [Puia dinghuensis]